MITDIDRISAFISQLGPVNLLNTLCIIDLQSRTKMYRSNLYKIRAIAIFTVVLYFVFAIITCVSLFNGQTFDFYTIITLVSGLVYLVVFPLIIIYGLKRQICSTRVRCEELREKLQKDYESSNKAVPFEYIEYTVDISNYLSLGKCKTISEAIDMLVRS